MRERRADIAEGGGEGHLGCCAREGVGGGAAAREHEAEHVAPTLGDVGTTLSHPASSSHRALTPAMRESLGISEGFFRISVGIEEPDLIEADLLRAAAAAAIA